LGGTVLVARKAADPSRCRDLRQCRFQVAGHQSKHGDERFAIAFNSVTHDRSSGRFLKPAFTQLGGDERSAIGQFKSHDRNERFARQPQQRDEFQQFLHRQHGAISRSISCIVHQCFCGTERECGTGSVEFRFAVSLSSNADAVEGEGRYTAHYRQWLERSKVV